LFHYTVFFATFLGPPFFYHPEPLIAFLCKQGPVKLVKRSHRLLFVQGALRFAVGVVPCPWQPKPFLVCFPLCHGVVCPPPPHCFLQFFMPTDSKRDQTSTVFWVPPPPPQSFRSGLGSDPLPKTTLVFSSRRFFSRSVPPRFSAFVFNVFTLDFLSSFFEGMFVGPVFPFCLTPPCRPA